MKHLNKIASMAVAGAMIVGSLALSSAAYAQGTGATPGDLGLGTIQAASGLGSQNLYQTIGTLIKVALSLLGIVAIVLVLYGGFRWMTAGGSEEKVDEAKKIIFQGIIGIAIILSAYAITTFVLGNLVTATGAGLTGV